MTAAAQWPWERLAESNAPSHDALVELLAPKPGERFLDVGTGSGGVALRAARAGASVVGVDVAEAALEQARRSAADESLDAEFVVADAQALPFEDASFDVVGSAFGVNFARDHAAAARGPIKALADALPPEEVEVLRARVLDVRDRFAGRPLSHIVVLGTRR